MADRDVFETTWVVVVPTATGFRTQLGDCCMSGHLNRLDAEATAARFNAAIAAAFRAAVGADVDRLTGQRDEARDERDHWVEVATDHAEQIIALRKVAEAARAEVFMDDGTELNPCLHREDPNVSLDHACRRPATTARRCDDHRRAWDEDRPEAPLVRAFRDLDALAAKKAGGVMPKRASAAKAKALAAMELVSSPEARKAFNELRVVVLKAYASSYHVSTSDGRSFPVPSKAFGDLRHRVRYGSESRLVKDRYVIASYLDMFAQLVEIPRDQREEWIKILREGAILLDEKARSGGSK